MAVFLRGSVWYVKIRRGGRQVLRSLNTSDNAEAHARAEALIRSLKGSIDTGSDTSPSASPSPSHTLGPVFASFTDRLAHQVQNGHVRPSYELDISALWKAHLSRFSGRLVDSQLNRAVIDYLDRQRLSVARRRKAHTLFRKLVATAGLNVAPHRFQSANPPKEKRPLTAPQLDACKKLCLPAIASTRSTSPSTR